MNPASASLRRSLAGVAIALVTLAAASADTHPAAFAPGGGNTTAGAEFALEFAPFVVELDFAHRFPNALGGRGLTLLNAIATPAPITFDARNWSSGPPHEWRATVGAALPLLVARRWNVVSSGFTDFVSQATVPGTILGLAFDFHVVPGYFASRWFLGADLGLRLEPWALVKNDSVVYEHFQNRYPTGTTGSAGPADGFYVFPATPRVTAGVAAEGRLGPVAVYAGAGWGSAVRIHTYARLGVRWEFL